MLDLGTVKPGSIVRIPFSSFDKDDGSSITMTNFAVADILVYKDGNTTERASTSGYTATTDFDSKTGKHLAIIDLADNTTAAFWSAGSEYHVAIDAVTVDSVTVGGWVARFRIGYTSSVLDTTIATLASQTSFTLTTGPAEDDVLNGFWAVVHDVASAVQCSRVLILDYTGSTKTITLAAGATFTVATTDNFCVMDMAPLQPVTTGRSLVVDAAGLADGNMVKMGPTGSGTAQTARDIGLSVLISSGTGTGQLSVTSGIIGANVTQFGGSAITSTGGRPEVNTTHWAGTAVGSATVRADLINIAGAAVNTSTAQLGVNVVNFGGSAGTFASGRAEVNVSHFGGSAGTFSGGRPEVNATHIAGTIYASSTLFTLASHDPGATIGTSTLTQTQVSGGAYALNSASFAFNAALDFTTAQKAATLARVTLVDTVTTLTGHTAQTGDSFARIGATGSGLTSLAPSATALSTAQWTNARAGYLDNLNTGVTIASGGITRASYSADTGHQSIRSNTAQAGGGTSITLDASASAVDDFYNNTLILITGGTGVGQARFVTNYDGTTKVASVTAWSTNPDNTSTFAIVGFDSIPGASAPSASDVATAVWTDLLASSDFSTATSIGKLLKDNIDAAITSRMATFTLPTNFSSLGINGSGHISRVVLADTVTTLTGHTAQTGDSFARIGATGSGLTSLAPSATALSTANWTTARAGYLDNINLTFPTNFSALGINASGHISRVVLVDTLTTYTSNTPQTGDSYARIGAAGVNLTGIILPSGGLANVTAWTVNLTGNLSGSVGSVTGAVGSVTSAVTLSAGDSPVMQSGTATAGGASTITIQSALGADSLPVGCVIKITSGTGQRQSRIITAYVNSTQVVTVDRPWTTAPDNTSVYTIQYAHSPALSTGLKVTGVVLTDTLTTYTGNTVQTGDSFARIGSTGSGLTSLAPSATALSTAQWTNTRAGYLDNLNTGVPVSTLSSTALASIWDRLTANITTASSIGKLLVDNVNATISSRSSHAAADVWSVGTRVLTAGTNIVLAKGTGITGFTDIDAAGVRTAVGLASANLDTQLSTIDTVVDAIKVVTDKLDTALEADGVAGYQFTTLALENGPTGGGGGTTDWTATERGQIRYRLGLDGSTDVPSASPTFTVTAINGVTFPTNFGSLGINGSGHISRVTLTDTATTLTNAPSDSAGTTTLLSRLTSGRAGNLDNLDATISSRMATFTLPTNFAALGINVSGHVSRVVLVDTLTTYTSNTPQTGDSFARIGATGSGLTSLAPSATALSTVQWTNTRAGYLDNISTLTSGRVSALDNLDALVSSRMATFTLPTNFSSFALNASGHVSRVTLVDTITAYTGNTVQTGDAFARIGATGSGLTSLAPSATALSTVQWTNTRAGLLDNLDAAVSTRMATFTLPSNFSALGINASGHISRVVLCDTITTYTNNTPQTGDSFIRIGLNGAGLIAVALVDGEAEEIADAILDRDLAGGSSGSDRTVRNSLRPNINKVLFDEPTVGKFTVYREDDTTVAWIGDYVRGDEDAGALIGTGIE